MKLNRATLSRLVPAVAVAGVLALSYIAQAPTLASNNDVGYGYANNCGVKGDGFHDLGKACPNRPFPGKGKGLTTAAIGNGKPSSETTGGTAGNTGRKSANESATTLSTLSGGNTDTQSQGKSSGHGKGLSRGKGHQSS